MVGEDRASDHGRGLWRTFTKLLPMTEVISKVTLAGDSDTSAYGRCNSCKWTCQLSSVCQAHIGTTSRASTRYPRDNKRKAWQGEGVLDIHKSRWVSLTRIGVTRNLSQRIIFNVCYFGMLWDKHNSVLVSVISGVNSWHLSNIGIV